MDNDMQDEYLVLINEEEQYSIWLGRHPVPDGWRAVGPKGSKEECVSYVDTHWTDMRPKSLRQILGEH